jgi:hypothetical protein
LLLREAPPGCLRLLADGDFEAAVSKFAFLHFLNFWLELKVGARASVKACGLRSLADISFAVIHEREKRPRTARRSKLVEAVTYLRQET